MMPVKNGQTSVVLRVKLLDSTSTVGAGLTGLSSSSSGLIISTIADNEATATAYTQAGSTIETITTLGTFAAPTATKCRFKEVDSTNHKGVYELQIADARFAVSSAKSLLVSILGVTGLAQADFIVPLVSDDPYVAKPANFASFSINGSGQVVLDQTQALSSAPTANTVGEALYMADATRGRFGTAQAGAASTITLDSGASSVDGRYVGYSVLLSGGTGGGLPGTVGQERTIVSYNGTTKVATVDTAWGTNPDNTTVFKLKFHPPVTFFGILGTVFTEGAVGRIAAAFKQFFNIASPAATMDHGVLVDTVTTYTGNTPQTGDSYARLGAPAGVSVSADVAAVKTDTGNLLTRLSAARAGYLDNLNIGGLVAASSEVTGLNVNTRVNLLVPIEIEIPDSSTQVYKVRLHLFDEVGNMEAPDSTPTVTLVNAAGTDRSSRLSSASNPSTGVYTWDYTATAGDAEEQLIWVFTVVEGGVTRTYPADSFVVEETAYRFTATDRSNLGAVKTKTDQLAFTVTNQVDVNVVDWKGATAPAMTGDAFARLGAPAGASVSADIAAIKTDTSNLLTRIPSALFSGITSLAQWLGLMAGKQTGNSTARTEIRATGAGSGTFDETTDSVEAIRDRGDAAWTTATGFSTLDAAGVRAAVGLASANLDAQLDALPTNAELATALGTADDAVLAAIAALPTADENADAYLDRADAIEVGLTPRQAHRLEVAAAAGKLSGAATTNVLIRNAVADSKVRIDATVDADGNRTAITADVS